MRSFTFVVVLLVVAVLGAVGCGADNSGNDMALPACPPGAEALDGAKCNYGVDRSCLSPNGYDCNCLCDGYWECDLVLLKCDGGVPHD